MMVSGIDPCGAGVTPGPPHSSHGRHTASSHCRRTMASATAPHRHTRTHALSLTHAHTRHAARVLLVGRPGEDWLPLCVATPPQSIAELRGAPEASPPPPAASPRGRRGLPIGCARAARWRGRGQRRSRHAEATPPGAWSGCASAGLFLRAVRVTRAGPCSRPALEISTARRILERRGTRE